VRMGIVDDILAISNDILSIRDEIGAIKHHIFIMERKWTEARGKGSFVDTKTQILPTPYLVDYSHDLRLKETGLIKQGDLIIVLLVIQKQRSII
jgi:hypothetical protein